MKDSIKRHDYIIVILILSVLSAILGPMYLTSFIRTELEWNQFYSRLGSDSLTLAGFVLTSLAIISRQIDREIFDKVRIYPGFRQLWRTFTVTAIVFVLLAVMVRVSELFYVPPYFGSIVTGLVVFGILLLITCIYLLHCIVSLINVDRIEELKKEVNTPSKI